jgi:hypothetical protein
VNRNRALVGWGGSALAAALIATGVLVATSGTSAPTTDSLVLNGRAPTTVELAVALRTGGSLSTSGTLWLNATTSSLSANLQVPVLTAPTDFSVRAVKNQLYFTSPNLANASGPVWYTLRVRWPSITSLARYLVKPNAALLSLLANARISHHGFATTYEFSRPRIALGTFGAHRTSSLVTGTLDVRLSTGRQGEFTGLWASLATKSATTTVTLNVLSYNHPVVIVAPPHSRATTPASPLIKQLLASGALGSLLLPTQLLQLLSPAKLG